MTFRNSILAGLTLVREAIRSQNYVAGVSGWSIEADGAAEFTGLVVNSAGVQGTITLENGEIVVRRNSDDEIIAKMFSSGNGGFLTRDPDSASVPFATMTSRYMRFNNEVSDPAQFSGEVSWSGNHLICRTSLASGAVAPGETAGNLSVSSSTVGINPNPSASIVGDNGVACSLSVGGDINITKTAPFSTTEHSLNINGVDQGRGLRDWVATSSNTVTVTTTETVGYSSGSTVFKNDRAYMVHVHLLLSSTVANDVVSTRTRRTNAAGAILMDSQSTAQIPGNNFTSVVDYSQVVKNDTGSDITDTLAVTYYRVSGTGNVRIVANATNVAFIKIDDIGPASAYPGAIALV